MADWNRQGGGQYWSSGTVEGTAGTLVDHATANVKGNWKELYTALPFDCGGLLININHNSALMHVLLDIGAGAAAAESVIIPNLHIAAPRAAQSGFNVFVPISVPKGTRLSGRITSSVTSGQIFTNLVALAATQDSPGYGRCESVGEVLASSRGTDIDPGTTANTVGTWQQIVAATGFRYRQLIICVNERANSAAAAINLWFDLGIGASSAEVEYIPKIISQVNITSDEMGQRVIGPLPVDIPAGTRIAARCRSESTDATDRLIQISLLGLG